MGGPIITAGKQVDLGGSHLLVAPGQHVAQFYRSTLESKDLMIRFLKAGIRAGDVCVCQTTPELTAQEIRKHLEELKVDVRKAFSSRRLHFQTRTMTGEHLKEVFFDRMRDAPAGAVFRWVGDVTHCLNRQENRDNTLASEQMLGELKAFRAVLLCQYDLSRLSGGVLMDAQSRHPVWIINDVLHLNPFYLNGEPSKSHTFDARYQILMEIQNAVSTINDSTLLATIADILRKIVPWDRLELTLADPSKDVFRVFGLVESGEVRKTIPVGTEFPRERSLILRVLEQKRPWIIMDLQQEEDHPEVVLYRNEGLRSGILVPLTKGNRVLGTLNIGSREAARYNQEDMELLVQVARHMALPVENLLAHEEIARLKARLEYENLNLKDEIQVEHQFKNLIGQSRSFRKVLRSVETVAPTDASVLFIGETGTGKELLVRAIHDLSPRKDGPLIKVNCAALPAGLIESELFGHEKGAFTGAFSRKIGRFELANGGTIFLDEVGDLQLDLQAKLLRVLQENEFERVGGQQTVRVDVRVVAATNFDLEKAIQDGKFRADLFYRLNVFPIRVPALREKKEDIPLLVKFFVMKYCARFRKNIERIPQSIVDRFLAYSWPGNVRELENLIERAVILSRGSELETGSWLPHAGAEVKETKIPTLEELEREHIIEVLEITGWRVSGERGAAKLLGMKATTLEARMKKLGIRRR